MATKFRRTLYMCALASVMFTLAACSEISTEHDPLVTTTATTTTTTAVTTVTTTATTPAVTTVTTAEPVETEYERIAPTALNATLEAEDFEVFSGAYVAQDLGDFSGEGYVDGFSFSTEAGVTLEFESNAKQYYDFDFYIFSETAEISKASILIGESEHTFEITETERYTAYSVKNVLLEKGTVQITVTGGFNDFCLDRVYIRNSPLYSDLYFELSRELCCENSSDRANQLFTFLCDNYMQNIISGQFVSSDENTELEIIHEATGYYPLIRMGDLSQYSTNGGEIAYDEIAACIDWHEKGGIVSLMWHWLAPMGESTVLAENCTFNLETAISDIQDNDLIDASTEELAQMLENEVISAECHALISDIDNISAQLALLRDADVPVIWRPLHEAGNGMFWWGALGADNYIALWQFMFERMTQYHELNNLIWVWNAQSETYLVPENMYDIASIDIYTSAQDTSSQYHSFSLLHKITNGKKILALSECSTIPDIASVLTDGSVWSYFGLWYGEYIADEYGRPNSEFNSKGYLTSVYSSVYTLTLDDGKNIYSVEETENE